LKCNVLCRYAAARDEITRAGKHAQFASVGTPYETEVFRYVPEVGGGCTAVEVQLTHSA
jgi:hypothetical protein